MGSRQIGSRRSALRLARYGLLLSSQDFALDSIYGDLYCTCAESISGDRQVLPTGGVSSMGAYVVDDRHCLGPVACLIIVGAVPDLSRDFGVCAGKPFHRWK